MAHTLLVVNIVTMRRTMLIRCSVMLVTTMLLYSKLIVLANKAATMITLSSASPVDINFAVSEARG